MHHLDSCILELLENVCTDEGPPQGDETNAKTEMKRSESDNSVKQNLVSLILNHSKVFPRRKNINKQLISQNSVTPFGCFLSSL